MAESTDQFIKSSADAIKASTNLLVSSGFSDVNSIKNDQYEFGDHLDFFDYHMYNDTGVLPSDYSSLELNKPCIIGECGQCKNHWDYSLQAEVTCSFLNDALNKEYSGCFLWNYNCKGFSDLDGNRWSLINRDGSHRPVCLLISQFAKKI